MPVRGPDGSIRIAVQATPNLRRAVTEGRTSMSVEFHALREHRTAGGVREIERALIDGAALTTPDKSEYHQTRAELRNRKRAQVWL